MSLLAGKLGIVFGVANKRSIAWAIAQAWHREGAKLAFTYQGERLKENVEELAGTFGADTLLMECDVTKDDHIARVFDEVGKKFGKLHLLLHSVAFAPKDALEGEFVNTSREAFRVAHDVSAYRWSRSRAARLMRSWGCSAGDDTAIEPLCETGRRVTERLRRVGQRNRCQRLPGREVAGHVNADVLLGWAADRELILSGTNHPRKA